MKRRNSLLENLDSKVSKNLPIRRYSLSDMISESYKALYECEKGSNLQRIVEAHLNDVRNNPSEIDRLSTQLCKVKELVRMIEAEEITDKDLKSVVSSKINGEVKESKDDEDVEEKDDNDVIDESASSTYTWGDWQTERGSSCRVRYYSSGMDLTNQIIGIVYEETKEQPYYGAEIYDNSSASTIEERADDSYHFDTEKEAKEWVEEWFRANESVHDEDVEETEDEDLLEDTDLTDEEVDELTKHLEEIRKNKKMKECDAPKKSVEESTKPRKLKRANEAAPVWSRYHIVNPDGETIDSYTDRKDAEDWVNQLYKDGDYKKGDLKVVDSQAKNESKSYDKLNLSEFNKKSSSKAFVKTFKKLDKKLHEGTALTRQESISLYKAANSAMTHLSVELEHNPEFLDTFKESVSLLSVDVDKLLGSLKEGKAPSKATMKSLAKFSEALLREDKVCYPNGVECKDDSVDMDKALDYQYGTDRDKDNSKYTTEEKQRALNYWIEKTDSRINEDEEEDVEDDIPIEDEEDSVSEESEEFDQEYADARVELHKELADEHAESEDPEVQEKLAQDAEEVTSLPGITDEQIAEITGEETPEEEEGEETPEEEEVEETDESVHDEDVEEVEEKKEEEPEDLDLGNDEITDDELAELKKHLKEMRKARVSESKKTRSKK